MKYLIFLIHLILIKIFQIKFLISNFNLKPLKIKIVNKMKHGEKKITGIADFSFINKNYSLEYEKNEKSFIFNQIDQLGKK